ncbi:hypothetical protein FACS1894103_6960 [Campylobacterota bacterium]|nr:hypothetical protein FACS1894103_6960 [Campylobacterota bacterium]
MFYHTEYSASDVKRMLEVGARRTTVPINPSEQDQRSGQPQEFIGTMNLAEQKLTEACSKIYLFENMTPRDVLTITKEVQFLRFAHRETFFVQGEDSKAMFYILTGCADVETTVDTATGKQTGKVGRVEAGNIVGEMAFIAHKSRNATCTAAAPETTAIRFEIDEDAVDERTSLIFLQLYINISGGLVRKLEKSNTTIVKLL